MRISGEYRERKMRAKLPLLHEMEERAGERRSDENKSKASSQAQLPASVSELWKFSHLTPPLPDPLLRSAEEREIRVRVIGTGFSPN
jgi:hypothetical protein